MLGLNRVTVWTVDVTRDRRYRVASTARILWPSLGGTHALVDELDRVSDSRRPLDAADLTNGRVSDAELLVLVSRDDVDAYDVLYRRWAERLAAFFYVRTADWEASRDLTADTLAVVWLRRRRFRMNGAAGSGWLFGIAVRELGKFRRRKGAELRAVAKLGVQIPEWDPGSMARVEEIIDVEAWHGYLAAGLEHLSAREREAVVLRVLWDLEYGEVAEAMRCSQAAARVRVHRALRKLALVVESVVEDGAI